MRIAPPFSQLIKELQKSNQKYPTLAAQKFPAKFYFHYISNRHFFAIQKNILGNSIKKSVRRPHLIHLLKSFAICIEVSYFCFFLKSIKHNVRWFMAAIYSTFICYFCCWTYWSQKLIGRHFISRHFIYISCPNEKKNRLSSSNWIRFGLFGKKQVFWLSEAILKCNRFGHRLLLWVLFVTAWRFN